MSDIYKERRRFTRVALDLPVDVHQGASVWHQRMTGISLSGVATDQPDVWDAQYNEPFTLVIHLDDSQTLELHAYLQHVEFSMLGFSVEHMGKENIQQLRGLLEDKVGDIALFEKELAQLD
ncbi:MAG: PilZ domain-containing protein [Halieaceae bacterium]|jgi:hypothetical protein|nr:PilZ domain-containing protein [Halieaceae bacterium]